MSLMCSRAPLTAVRAVGAAADVRQARDIWKYRKVFEWLAAAEISCPAAAALWLWQPTIALVRPPAGSPGLGLAIRPGVGTPCPVADVPRARRLVNASFPKQIGNPGLFACCRR